MKIQYVGYTILLLSLLICFGCKSAPEEKKVFSLPESLYRENYRVHGRIQAAADANSDGILQKEEQERLFSALNNVAGYPHQTETFLDNFFDRNKDGQLDLHEIDELQHLIYKNLLKLHEIAPELAKIGDRDGNNQIDDGMEIALVMDYLITNQSLMNPHKSKTPIDEHLDKNENGHVEFDEILWYRCSLFWAVLDTVLFPVQLFHPLKLDCTENKTPSTYLELLADTNGDGILSKAEGLTVKEKMKREHPVHGKFDEILDINMNKNVEHFELESAIFYHKLSLFQNTWKNSAVENEQGSLFDSNQDGYISIFEMERALTLFYHPEDFNKNDFPALTSRIDMDKDGTFSEEERAIAQKDLLQAHFCANGCERDKNGNSFLEREELGLTGRGMCVWEITSPNEHVLLRRIQHKKGQRLKDIVGLRGTVAVRESINENTDEAFLKSTGRYLKDVLDSGGIAGGAEMETADIEIVKNSNEAISTAKRNDSEVVYLLTCFRNDNRLYLSLSIYATETGKLLRSSSICSKNLKDIYSLCMYLIFSL